MPAFDKRIDVYITRAEPFAVPILEYLRDLVHEACPDVTETMKWSFPHFEYNGGILCSMASFKNHCAFGFWNGAYLKDAGGVLERGEKTSMGHLGKITSIKDLPSKKILIQYLKESMAIADSGAIPKKVVVKEKKELLVPRDFVAALKKNKQARIVFDGFSYSNKKEYVEWISEAKTESTRNKRMTTALEWLAEGKIRNWKYQK